MDYSVERLLLKKDGKVTEGYLGSPDKAKILFVLREPNISDSGRVNGFWFKNVVDGKVKYDENVSRKAVAKRAETQYLKVLGRLAEKLLNKEIQNTDEAERQQKRDLLKECAYINLFPFGGDNTASAKYIQTRNAIKGMEPSEDFEGIEKLEEECKKFDNVVFKKIAQNRMNIICNMNCKYIVTTKDIFDALLKSNLNIKEHDQGFFINSKENFRKARINIGNREVFVYDFYHPAYRISNNKLDSLKIYSVGGII